MADDSSASPSPAPEVAPAPTKINPRLWPGVLAVALVWGLMLNAMVVFPESAWGFMPLMFGMPASFGLAFVWWLFASRVPWRDRWIGLAVVVGGLAVGTFGGFHKSMTGMTIFMVVAPYLLTACVLSLLVTRPLGWGTSKKVGLVTALACLGLTASVRNIGNDSSFRNTYLARWDTTAEEDLVASLEAEQRKNQAAAGEASWEIGAGDWPGFRGSFRDGLVLGNSVVGSWQPLAPAKLWSVPVGPGYSSFCVVGSVIYTQEQLDKEECVTAYNADTGERIWMSNVEARFHGPASGPGPRATPTYFEGHLYTTGAEGAVQRIDASSGKVLWARNLIEDSQIGSLEDPAKRIPPDWGFSSSPLVVTQEDGPTLAIVYAGNPAPAKGVSYKNESVIAYDAETGEPVWKSGTGYHSYSSPHLATLGGVEQVLMLTNVGLESLDPSTGERLWFYEWNIGEMGRTNQPLVVDEQTVVLSAGYDSGTIPIRVIPGEGGWTVEKLWDKPSRDLVPYFNDSVLYEGHLYGFHKKFLTCINLETGKPTWPRKVKRQAKFGNGQVVLDPATGMLLVTDENTGEVLLIEATPETLKVAGRLQALDPGVNWNHPVVANGRLYVRNAAEAACYELPKAMIASR